MKKVITLILLVICLICAAIGIMNVNKNKTNNLEKITVAEVTHSMFYAPWYVAIEKGYFEEEGLEIELILTPGADKVTSAVLSKDADIGFAGIEASIYVYNNGEEDYIVNFAGLTKRDGQFIVGDCKYKDNFKTEDLKGKTVLAGRTGGMPLMNFTYALKNNNIKNEEVKINTSVEFAALAGAYIGEQGEFVNLFEPTALQLEKEGYGCVLDSIGAHAGDVPYTVFGTTKSYFKENEDVIEKFTKAINKGIKFVKENKPSVIANTIYEQFPDNSINEIETIVKRYKDADSWWDNTYINEEAYNRFIDIMKYNDAITKKPNFNDIVNNKFNE